MSALIAAVAACAPASHGAHNVGRNAAKVGSHAAPANSGEVGAQALLRQPTSPVPGFVCDHTGHDRDACLADHWALMARLNTYA